MTGGADEPRPAGYWRSAVETVQSFVERITPKLAGEDRYHAQVAAYLLGICGREIAVPAGTAEIERRIIADFLGQDGVSPELTQALSAAIRAGACDARWDEAMALVLQQVVDKVSVVRPDHLAPEHCHGRD
ncbi:MAG: DUF6285 domain-containing protein [Aliidongia sp.]